VNVAFLTADDPVYLPDFFERVLGRIPASTAAVYRVPPLYGRQSPLSAALRYARTFGVAAALRLTGRVARARFSGRSIAAVCWRHGVPCTVAADVNAPEFLAALGAGFPDVIVSVSCPQIFRAPLIALPKRGLLNVHGAILPAYRGVMPGFWMLANGESRAGVSVHFVDDGIDTGDLCGQEVFEILPRESLDAFLRRSKAIAADLVVRVLEAFERGTVARTPIDAKAGSYYSWPDRAAVRRFRARGRRVW
jgi:methionyl-tRNA formyltransferase